MTGRNPPPGPVTGPVTGPGRLLSDSELAKIRDGLAEATGVKYAVMRQLFDHIDALTAERAGFHAECDKVDIPYDPEGLVKYHRMNSCLAATYELQKQQQIKRALTAERDALTAQNEALRRVVDADITADDAEAVATDSYGLDLVERVRLNNRAAETWDERRAALAAWRAEYEREVPNTPSPRRPSR